MAPLLERVSSRNTPWQIRNISRVTGLGLLIDNCVPHFLIPAFVGQDEILRADR